MRHVHGLTVTSLHAGLLGVVLVAAVRPASAAPIPARYLTLYRHAARTCPGLTWPVLARIGAARGPRGLRRAIFAYNHACWYVRDVLAIAVSHTH